MSGFGKAVVADYRKTDNLKVNSVPKAD